jgi:uncharacterized coiled-coil protein SlyX
VVTLFHEHDSRNRQDAHLTPWRYVAASTASLFSSAAVSYAVYPVVDVAPLNDRHRWVFVLYAMSATALLGGWVCNRWRMLGAIAAWLRALITSLVHQHAFEPDTPIEELQARLAEMEARHASQIEALERQIAAQGAQIGEQQVRIDELRKEIRESSAREKTGAALDVLGILLASVASMLWAAGLA